MAATSFLVRAVEVSRHRVLCARAPRGSAGQSEQQLWAERPPNCTSAPSASSTVARPVHTRYPSGRHHTAGRGVANSQRSDPTRSRPRPSPTTESAASRRSGADARAARPHRLSDSDRRLMLPAPQHEPPAGLKQGRRLQITSLVPVDLRAPTFEVRRWHREALGAAVPVAAVDEQSDADPGKQQVRRPTEARLWTSVHAIAQPVRLHEPTHGQLSLGATSTVALHGPAGGVAGHPRRLHASRLRLPGSGVGRCFDASDLLPAPRRPPPRLGRRAGERLLVSSAKATGSPRDMTLRSL